MEAYITGQSGSPRPLLQAKAFHPARSSRWPPVSLLLLAAATQPPAQAKEPRPNPDDAPDPLPLVETADSALGCVQLDAIQVEAAGYAQQLGGPSPSDLEFLLRVSAPTDDDRHWTVTLESRLLGEQPQAPDTWRPESSDCPAVARHIAVRAISLQRLYPVAPPPPLPTQLVLGLGSDRPLGLAELSLWQGLGRAWLWPAMGLRVSASSTRVDVGVPRVQQLSGLLLAGFGMGRPGLNRSVWGRFALHAGPRRAWQGSQPLMPGPVSGPSGLSRPGWLVFGATAEANWTLAPTWGLGSQLGLRSPTLTDDSGWHSATAWISGQLLWTLGGRG